MQSFYKIFGYPTGVGCLLARKAALAKLRRPWFAGGTITVASVQGDKYYLAEGEAAFEEGTARANLSGEERASRDREFFARQLEKFPNRPPTARLLMCGNARRSATPGGCRLATCVDEEKSMSTGLNVVLSLCVVASATLWAAGDQAPRLSLVMREKLDHSKAILGAVVTSDWSTLDRESRALAHAAQDPARMALTAPEYLRYSDAFRAALQHLIESSARKDLDAASKAEVALTLSCVDCHRYVARRRLAQ